MSEKKQQLNEAQLKAVLHGKGPLLIIAGAGTGKTTVITQRIAHLILDKKVGPDRILALTFTEKSAAEMEGRVDKALPYGYVDLWISTFHAFCEKILRMYGHEIGLPTDFKLLTQTDQWLLIRQNLDRFDLKYYKPRGNPTKFIHELLSHFSRAKDEEISVEEYREYANTRISELNAESDEVAKEDATKALEVASAYETYQNLLLENSYLDFGDLISYTLNLVRARAGVRKRLNDQFEYILVDEFQDTNFAQYELIKLLCGENANLTVVGDDDQCLPAGTLIDTPNGKKRIEDFFKGDEVITGYGRGLVGVSNVTAVVKNTKNVRFLDILTDGGAKLRVTDNHKMFAYLPNAETGYYYVYLMYREGVGYRLGMTNKIITRLRLERSADSILALGAFATEEQARYQETLWSLRYGIPTACFKERDGIVMKAYSLSKLYQTLDVQFGVDRLVKELRKDLAFPHFILQGVNRGQKNRMIVRLKVCNRRYKGKPIKGISRNYSVLHELSFEISDKKTIAKLKFNGYRLRKSKGGMRYIRSSANLDELVHESQLLSELTGAFREEIFQIGIYRHQSLGARVMPAKNLIEGLMIPVRHGGSLRYEKITSIKECFSRATVYDLEVAKTHNFIANGIAVHNSIYKFRGASISNILQFKKDFPKSKEILLFENYRSAQNILDLSYNFIQLNNPNRLEVALNKVTPRLRSELRSGQGIKRKKLIKKLKALPEKIGEIEHLHFDTLEGEVEGVVKKIAAIKKSRPELSWADFAILVRANDSATHFTNFLRKTDIPFQFLALKGLYTKPVILDVIAYFKLLDNYHEGPAMFRVLSSPFMDLNYEDMLSIINYAHRRTWSVYQTLRRISEVGKIKDLHTISKLNHLIKMIDAHTELAKRKGVAEVFIAFLQQSKILDQLLKDESAEDRMNMEFLQSFYKRIQKFETSYDEPTLNNFMIELEMEMDSGERGTLAKDSQAGPDVVTIMTIHSSKGLEFEYIFLPNMVDKKFPTIERSEAIEIPEALVKDIVPEGDIHLQEERRLFYVAMTRAKRGLFFSSAEDYGGARAKKLSRFLFELNQTSPSFKIVETQATAKPLPPSKLEVEQVKVTKFQPPLPSKFSFSQIASFMKCPYQYKLSFVYHIPMFGKAVFSYGKTMHSTMEHFFTLVADKMTKGQADIFSAIQNTSGKGTIGELVEKTEMKRLLDECWIDEWFESENQKKEYLEKAEESVNTFYDKIAGQEPRVKFLEKPFTLKLEGSAGESYTIRGVIDRVDELADGSWHIVDYKTGQAKDKLEWIDRMQLLIYQVAAIELFNAKVSKLTYYYLDSNVDISFVGEQKDIDKLKKELVETIEAIKTSKFDATPGFHCGFCDYKDICEYKQ